jgi:hypothetical protein
MGILWFQNLNYTSHFKISGILIFVTSLITKGLLRSIELRSAVHRQLLLSKPTLYLGTAGTN